MVTMVESMHAIAEAISAKLKQPLDVYVTRSVGGGCISSAFCIEAKDGRRIFVKANRASLAGMFAAEFAGLSEIAATQTVKVPVPITTGVAGGQSFLALEYLDLTGRARGAMATLGRQLAALHNIEQPYFGWAMDNTIGSTLQPNPQSADWVAFFQEHRLAHQLELAARGGYGGRLQQRGEELIARMPGLFIGRHISPALLHGDLWSGNASTNSEGVPVVYDPACYYGDREADLAMTELFGGFGQEFYAAYQEVFTLDQGYRVRKNLYNLYQILNHLNLFGGGYLSQSMQMIDSLLSDLR